MCVTAIITVMTGGEKPFFSQTLDSVLSEPEISQILICVSLTNDWIESLPLINDSRITLVRIPLAHPGAVRNSALKYVQNPWIAYCDGDDVWIPGKTQKQLNEAIEKGCDFIGCDHYLMNEEGSVRAFALARYIPMPSSWLVKTEIMKKYPFNESLAIASDGDWWTQNKSNFSKIRLPQPLIKYRVRQNSVSSSTPSKRRKALIISISQIPILQQLIFLSTWILWLFYRSNVYAYKN
ncbi:MAG: glycosyltransferase family 2 protein [Mojavia pulchra JT2-VF2]|jgi:glycosyltransferase involved in cell wall biosynthesis|uniref:Glycosyltransferase family 2 protein n=1 Tax=Mojavia pulchra JT2-VF2 TaxID=287848 RepID=A0A951Q208_9NOST|nr:glycosyltransferase family 2 protein [Mojavia pulchra JT2-VF2]